MNLTSLNGGLLNGLGFSVVLATAAISCSSEVSAFATRQQDALAPTYSYADVSASAIVFKSPFADIDGAGELYPSASQQFAATANLSCTAQITAFVLRKVIAESSLGGSADIVAIPASTLGSAASSGEASVSAEATRVQPGNSSGQGVAAVDITTAPLITRLVYADISGTAALRVETRINGIQEAYGNPRGTSDVSISDTLLRISSAEIVCTSDIDAAATVVQFGNVDGSSSVEVEALATVNAYGYATLSSSSSLSVDGTRVLEPTSEVAASCNIVAAPVQTFATQCDLLGAGSVESVATRILHGAVEMEAIGAIILADPVVWEQAFAELPGSGSFQASAVIEMAGSAELGGSADVAATALSNADALDPPERTFYKAEPMTEFIRPFIESEFRRAA